MTIRPGFFGGRRGDAADREGDDEYAGTPEQLLSPLDRLSAPLRPALGGFGAPATLPDGRPFDPVWGTLGPPAQEPARDPWLEPAQPGIDEDQTVVDVEVVGNGFQISGSLHTGRFERLSDWLNMQQGFISVQEATLFHPGNQRQVDPDRPKGQLWVRLDQVVLVAEHRVATPARPGAPYVQKQRRRVTIVTPGYSLRGSIHLHAQGSMQQYLESPDPHFLPITDLVVRWLMDETLVSHHTFALINRQQLISVLEEPARPDGGVTASDRMDRHGEETRAAVNALSDRGAA